MVIISIFTFKCFWILHYILPGYILSWKVCFISTLWMNYSATAPLLYMFTYWYIFTLHTIYYLGLYCLGKLIICPYCEKVILPQCHRYIWVCINIFVCIISMFTAIYVCYLLDILLVCTSYWEDCYIFILYMIYTATR